MNTFFTTGTTKHNNILEYPRFLSYYSCSNYFRMGVFSCYIKHKADKDVVISEHHKNRGKRNLIRAGIYSVLPYKEYWQCDRPQPMTSKDMDISMSRKLPGLPLLGLPARNAGGGRRLNVSPVLR